MIQYVFGQLGRKGERREEKSFGFWGYDVENDRWFGRRLALGSFRFSVRTATREIGIRGGMTRDHKPL